MLLVRPEHQANLLKDTMNPAVDVDGDRFIDAHVGTLPVWEKDGFYDQMQPLVQAFADHGREDLFVDALVVLHRHWPTHDSTDTQNGDPSGHGFSKESAANSFEPMLVKVLEETDFWHALVDVSPTLNNIVVNGKNGRRVLANAGRYIFNPQAGLTNRLGGTSTTTEEGTPVTTLSPWRVLADAYKGKRGVIETSASEGEAWERSTSQMVDIFLRGEDVAGTWRFKNPRVRGVSVALIDFMSGRVSAHRQAGDLIAWSRTELPADLRDTLAGPVFAGAADFVLSLVAASGARAALENLNAYLTSEAGAPEAFVTALTGAGDLVQLLLDDENLVPILNAVGQILHPDFGKEFHSEYSFVDAQLDFLRAARAADETSALAKLLGYAFAELPGGERTSVGQLIDSIGEVQREHPIADLGLPLSAGDYVSTFRAVAEFLGEEQRGFLKFVKIVKERNVRD